MRTRLAAIAFVLAANLATRAPSPAEACMNGVIMSQSEAAKKVVQAEKALENGKPARAYRLLEADYFEVESKDLLRRVHRVRAIAALRSGRRREAEIAFGRMLAKDKNNPVLLALYAESLAHRKGDPGLRAFEIMADLDKRDLIPDAHGYAVLAHLRARAGDAEGLDRALASCRKLAPSKQVAKLCRVEHKLLSRLATKE